MKNRFPPAFEFSIGQLHIRLYLPVGVQDAMLPAYLKSVTAPIFPDKTLDLHLHPLHLAPSGAVDISGQYGLGRAAMIPPPPSPSSSSSPSSNPSTSSLSSSGARSPHILSFEFYVHLPFGPERPDRLPTKCVIPALYVALSSPHIGVFAIHASAVARVGQALVFAGPSGHGKSTCAAELVARGCDPMADDRVLLWRHSGGNFLASASCECPNPFSRRVHYPAETGAPPRRNPDRRDLALPIRRLFVPHVLPDSQSASTDLSTAQAMATLAASVGHTANQRDFATLSPIPDALVPGALVPGAPVPGAPVPGAPVPGAPVPTTRLTLGRDAAKLFDDILAL